MSVPTITLNDGVQIPQLGLGVWQVTDDEATPVVATALEVGYRHIDTAQGYQNETGVGKAIRESGIPRDEIFVTTKLTNEFHLRDDARRATEQSLTRLGLDHLDLYLIHWPATVKYGDAYLESWEVMNELKSEGLIRSIGVSNFNAEHLDALRSVSSTVPSVNQVECHPTFLRTDLLPELLARGIALESYSPLGQASDLAEPTIGGIAASLGRTPAQVILRWHLQHGFIVIPKSVHAERIASNFDVFDFELDADQIASIDSLDTGNRLGADPLTAPW
ncbi:MAG TPA: aldo/keto reductase [Propionibacteriaceae bacterium]|nr:aldo/keto reductase [Propionibacteriaceae bacterium]